MSSMHLKQYTHEVVVKISIDTDKEFEEITNSEIKNSFVNALQEGKFEVETTPNACMCMDCMRK